MKITNGDQQGRMFQSVFVKTTYTFDEDFNLIPDPEQEPFNFTDHCYEDFNTSSLMYPSDLVPFKPNTDIIINANSYPPDGKPMKHWNCGVRIEGQHRVEKQLMVYGPRQWVPKWSRELNEEERQNWQKYRKCFKKWELSEPELTNCVPIRYENSFGGMQERAKDGGKIEYIAFERNPIGTGWIDKELTDHTTPMRAPQLESFTGGNIDDPYQIYNPESLGPIPPAWLPRRPLGGTYDQNWIDNIWPHWPPDYDFNYHNSAPSYLQYPNYMRGDEHVQLLNLWPDRSLLQFSLIGEQPIIKALRETGKREQKSLNLDTVYIDLLGENHFDVRVYLTWRMVYFEDQYSEFVVDDMKRATVEIPVLSATTPTELFTQYEGA